MMVWPLAEQRLAAELSNLRQEEAEVMDLELFVRAVADSHQSLGATTGGALDLASLPVLLRDADCASVGFHNYLIVGTNVITLPLIPEKVALAAYMLHAPGLGAK